ncbi:metal-dependent hydrolase family protein [Terriglobus roseus]|uniref:Imidazolonepropionase n=1 Tax=Terriglobus roseus TaxID=392734 RepID=A0A1H4RIW7_9BACT|nr:amidohydrolase family protein [Terriglobus roseus]SEC31833.1 Imidazolonepropionase [Terriglobus roseus]
MRLPLALIAALLVPASLPAQTSPQAHVIVLHASRLLDVVAGRTITPGEVLVEGNLIREAGTHVTRPAGAEVIDLGDVTLMPGLIDAHTHLFLHVGNEAGQTVDETVPQRTLIAADAARTDLLAGFTAERDMGSEGAGCADAAVRNAINSGLIPGPRMRVSCNAVDITGGHEDNSGKNPEQHLLSNADRADSAEDLIHVMREQHKQGADFTKIYETGQDRLRDGVFTTPFQYTQADLSTAVAEAKRTGSRVAVHATGEPGTGYAAAAGVASIDHADNLSAATMKLMKEHNIFAVPTFAIGQYFADHAETPASAARRHESEAFHAAEFKKQMAAGVPFAVGSDVGPFPHGTQAHELVLMHQYGMPAADVLRADLINGAKLLDWEKQIGQLQAGFLADGIAVPGNPLEDLSVVEHVSFVMKDGAIIRH